METTMKTVTPDQRIAGWVEGGASIEAIGGACAVILAILGLMNFAPAKMAAVAGIALGASLFLESGFVSGSYEAIRARFEGGTHPEFGGGLGVEMVAGMCAIVLGILTLLMVEPPALLMGIATLVLGAGVALSSGVTGRLNSAKLLIRKGTDDSRIETRHAIVDAALTQVVLGVAAAVLGILALAGVSPSVLILVAMLGLGVSALYSGGALAGRMWSVLRP